MAEANEFSAELSIVEGYLEQFFKGNENSFVPEKKLLESVRYSLHSGGKRFRPLLSVLTAKALGESFDKVLPFAAAVEFIHTYSLIHDDLPSMDNDNERRGKPTNHIVFGEAMALLAGDTLLTEAFHLIGKSYSSKPEIASRLVVLLGEAIGQRGMVAGQVLDIALLEGKAQADIGYLKKLHALKTGALIRVAIEGAAIACEISSVHQERLRQFGSSLGFAFQLADDLLDYDPKNPEVSGYPNLLGLDQTKQTLQKESDQAQSLLDVLPGNIEGLQSITEFNLQRSY